MVKRVLAAPLGCAALLAAYAASVYAIAILGDLRNFDTSAIDTIPFAALMGGMAVGAGIIGLRLLLFGATGRYQTRDSRLRATLLGCGSFFPGFLFSYVAAAFIGAKVLHGGDMVLDAVLASLGVGIITAGVSTFVLLRRRRSRVSKAQLDQRTSGQPA